MNNFLRTTLVELSTEPEAVAAANALMNLVRPRFLKRELDVPEDGICSCCGADRKTGRRSNGNAGRESVIFYSRSGKEKYRQECGPVGYRRLHRFTYKDISFVLCSNCKVTLSRHITSACDYTVSIPADGDISFLPPLVLETWIAGRLIKATKSPVPPWVIERRYLTDDR